MDVAMQMIVDGKILSPKFQKCIIVGNIRILQWFQQEHCQLQPHPETHHSIQTICESPEGATPRNESKATSSC